jgi:GNAT superfamily N-acetyltransferase
LQHLIRPFASAQSINALEPRAGRVRAATRRDLPEIARLITAALATFRGAVPGHVLDVYIDESRAIARQWDGGEILVFENNHRIVGTVVYYRTDAAGKSAAPRVRTLMVAPHARGRGFGHALMQACLDRARRDGARHLELHTAAFMTSAVALYERMGFVRDPGHDSRASDLLGFDPARGDVDVIAYRCEL